MAKKAPPGRAPSIDERRSARADWPVRKFRLSEEPVDDFSAYAVAERMMMVEQLSIDA